MNNDENPTEASCLTCKYNTNPKGITNCTSKLAKTVFSTNGKVMRNGKDLGAKCKCPGFKQKISYSQ